MKKNKMKTSHSSSFGRLWSYLQAYRFPLYLAIFLKIVSVIMSVLEPVVIGLAITELTKNTLAIIKGVEGAHINVSYVGLVLVVYLLRGLIYELAAYYSNYFMTNAVQATVQDMRNEMTEKILIVPQCHTLISTSLETSWDALPVTSRQYLMPCSSHSCRLLMPSLL